MVAIKAHASTTPIGSADITVIQAAYALSKAQSEQSAREIVDEVPVTLHTALLKHMREHRNLFLPEVHAVVAAAIESPRLSKAEALFS